MPTITTSPRLSPRQQWQVDLFRELQTLRMECPSYSPNSAELYLSGFATVQVSVSDREVTVERYYDNEMLNDGRQVTRSFPISETDFPDLAMIARLCRILAESIRSDEPLLNFGE